MSKLRYRGTSGRVRGIPQSGPDKNLQSDNFQCHRMAVGELEADTIVTDAIRGHDAAFATGDAGESLIIGGGSGDGAGVDGVVICRADAFMQKVTNPTQTLTATPSDMDVSIYRGRILSVSGSVAGQILRLPNYALLDLPGVIDDDGLSVKLHNAGPERLSVADSADGTGVVVTTGTANTITAGEMKEITIQLDVTAATYEAWLEGGKATGLQTMWVPAAAMIYAVTNGPGAFQVETSANLLNYRTLLFDGTTEESAHFEVAFPKSWDEGTITFQVFWEPTTTDAVNNTVIWGLEGVFVGNATVADTSYATGTAGTVSDDGDTADTVYVTATSSAVTIANTPTVDGIVNFRFYRDATTDDYPDDARLRGIKLFYTRDAEADN